jgi:hypothetical protein
MQALYPYDNTLRAIRISGRQLREYLEFSARYYVTDANGNVSVDPKVPGFNFDVLAGADYVLDLSRPQGQRVTRLEVRGRPVAPTDSFTLALTNYRQTGGGSYTMIADAPVVYDRQQDIRQLLTDEVRRAGVLRPQDYFTRNWRLEPAGVVAPLYAQMRRSGAGGGPSAPAAAAAPSRPLARRGPPRGCASSAPTTSTARSSRAWTAAVSVAAARHIWPRRFVAPAPSASLRMRVAARGRWRSVSGHAGVEPRVRPSGRSAVQSLGYVAAALGNHEFDWGQDTLRARMRDARYPFLGANVRLRGRPGRTLDPRRHADRASRGSRSA